MKHKKAHEVFGKRDDSNIVSKMEMFIGEYKNKCIIQEALDNFKQIQLLDV